MELCSGHRKFNSKLSFLIKTVLLQKFLEIGGIRIDYSSAVTTYGTQINKWAENNSCTKCFLLLSLIITFEIGIIVTISIYIRGT